MASVLMCSRIPRILKGNSGLWGKVLLSDHELNLVLSSLGNLKECENSDILESKMRKDAIIKVYILMELPKLRRVLQKNCP